MSLHSTQYTPRVSNAIALHFPPAVNDFPSVSFTALLTAHFTLFTLFTLYPLHRSPNHLQLQSFLSITSHPLANSLVPNPNERCSPLSFGVPPFSSVFRLLWTIFLHFLSLFSYLFPVILHFLPVFNDFPSFSLVFSSLFPAGVNGPRGNRSLPSPLCVVVHAPQKSSIYTPSTATNFEILAPHATTTPQTP